MRHDFGMRGAIAVGVVAALGLMLAGACKHDPDDGARDHELPVAVPPIPSVDDHCDPAQPRQCIGDDVWACEASGVLGRRIQACHEGCEDGKCNPTCADDGVGLIYVVDAAQQLFSFDPRELPSNPFKLIGTLRCEDGEPFSMAIDRHGVAWVVYGSGHMFKVSTTDATCKPTRFVPSTRFGMGFVTDGPGQTTEKLFLAADDAFRTLSFVDTAHDLAMHKVGVIQTGDDHNPELTGTNEGKLFGFYPVSGKIPFVQEISRNGGGPVGRRWPLGKISFGEINAYAFAQWGGVFYVFMTTVDEDGFNSSVRAVDRATGNYRTVLEHLPYRITGAGVSTCAPERDQ